MPLPDNSGNWRGAPHEHSAKENNEHETARRVALLEAACMELLGRVQRLEEEAADRRFAAAVSIMAETRRTVQ